MFNPVFLQHWIIGIRIHMIISKSALFHYTHGSDITIIISAPDSLQMQLFKSISQNFSDCFRNQPFAPKRNPQPVTDLAFCLRSAPCSTFSRHYADASCRLAVSFPRHNSKGSCSAKYRTDDCSAVTNVCMRQPPGIWSDLRIPGIPVQHLCIRCIKAGEAA